MDSTTLSSEKRAFVTSSIHDLLTGGLSVEFAVLTLDPTTKAPKAKIYRPAEIDALLLSEGLTKKEEAETK